MHVTSHVTTAARFDRWYICIRCETGLVTIVDRIERVDNGSTGRVALQLLD